MGQDPAMRRRAAAGLLIGLPVVGLLVLLLGGTRVRQCLGGSTCAALPPVEGLPIIGTTGGLVTVLVTVGVAWLAIAWWVLRRAWHRDRSMLRRSALVVSLLPIATGVAVFVLELLQGQRRRSALETGVGCALLVASFLAPIVLARLALTRPSPD
jgi:hypothetical protein